jgi:hypothetical protein
MFSEQLERAHERTSRSMMAALTLGNMDFLHLDLVWLRDLLANHAGGSEQALTFYLRTYLAAIESHLHEHGAIMANWLHDLADAKLLDEPHRPARGRGGTETRLHEVPAM